MRISKFSIVAQIVGRYIKDSINGKKKRGNNGKPLLQIEQKIQKWHVSVKNSLYNSFTEFSVASKYENQDENM